MGIQLALSGTDYFRKDKYVYSFSVSLDSVILTKKLKDNCKPINVVDSLFLLNSACPMNNL